MDLYEEARLFPLLLRGRKAVATAVGLRNRQVRPARLRWAVRRARVERIGSGLFLLGRGPSDLLDQVRAALAVCPPEAVVGYETAAALLGFGIMASPDVHVVVPAGAPFPQRRGIVVHRSSVPVLTPERVLGIACTPAVRTAIDLARSLPRVDALPVLDAALYGRACDQDDLRSELVAHAHLRGIRAVRELVELADGRSQCRQETQLRLILHSGGLVSFEPQVEVSEGGQRYVLDLADRERRVAAEYDGASHLDRFRLRADRSRHNWLESRGWRMRYFTNHDLYTTPADTVATMRAAFAVDRGLSVVV